MINPFQKTPSEKALAKVAKQKFNARKRKIIKGYTNRQGTLGLKTNVFTQIPTLFKMAEAIELELLNENV